MAFPVGDVVEIALGPKLGFWGADYYQDSRARGYGSGTYSGYDFGHPGRAAHSATVIEPAPRRAIRSFRATG